MVSGISEPLAAEIVALERVRRKGSRADEESAELARVRRQVVNARRDAFVALFRKDLITDDELHSALLQLGMPPDLVEPMVEKELVMKIKPEPLNVPKPPTTLQ